MSSWNILQILNKRLQNTTIKVIQGSHNNSSETKSTDRSNSDYKLKITAGTDTSKKQIRSKETKSKKPIPDKETETSDGKLMQTLSNVTPIKDISLAEASLEMTLRIGKNKLKKTCRICLKEGNIPIYGSIDISEDINTFAGIQISQEDTFPKYLCEGCDTLLHSAVLFRTTAQESDRILKQGNEDSKSLFDDSSMSDDAIETLDFNDDNTINMLYEDNTKNILWEQEATEDILNNGDQDITNLHTVDIKHSNEDNTIFNTQVHKSEDIYKVLENCSDNNRLTCTICNKGDFESLIELNKHLRTNHKYDIDRLLCPICQKKVIVREYNRHFKRHTIECTIMCDVCGKKFKSNAAYKSHHATHFLTELKFECQFCPYKGRNISLLKNHMKTHTGEKKYKCPHCPSRYFANGCNMRRHMQTHKKENNYQCDICSKGFFRKSFLVNHIEVHHHGKRYMCNVCGSEYTRKSGLSTHMRKVHKLKSLGKMPLYKLLEAKTQNETLVNMESS